MMPASAGECGGEPRCRVGPSLPEAASQNVVLDEPDPPVAGTKPTLFQEATPPTRPKISLAAVAAASILGIRPRPKLTSR